MRSSERIHFSVESRPATNQLYISHIDREVGPFEGPLSSIVLPDAHSMSFNLPQGILTYVLR